MLHLMSRMLCEHLKVETNNFFLPRVFHVVLLLVLLPIYMYLHRFIFISCHFPGRFGAQWQTNFHSEREPIQTQRFHCSICTAHRAINNYFHNDKLSKKLSIASEIFDLTVKTLKE